MILAALRSGDVDRAVQLLLETFQDEVYGYCTRLVGVAKATRVYERILSTAIEDLQNEQVDTSLRAWIYGIARNAVMHQHRVDRRTYPNALDPDYVPVFGPDTVPGVRLQDEPMEAALENLAPPVREILHLIYWHGLHPAEAAHVTGHPVEEVHEMAASGLSHVSLCLQQGSAAPS